MEYSYIKCCIFFCAIVWVQWVVAEEWTPGVPKSLSAAWGRDACLPCGGDPIALDGPNAYVQWLKDDTEMVGRFSYVELTTDREDSKPSWCAARGSLRLYAREIVDVTDGSEYRCRVHYQYAPPVDFLIDLSYVEPPQIPKIFNDRNEEVTWGYVGPFLIGSDMRLLCKVAGGKPGLRVFWRRDGETIREFRYDSESPDPVVLDVLVQQMGRAEAGARYECLATNVELSQPLRASIAVKMYMPPLIAQLRIVDELEVVSGQVLTAECTITGSYPPSSITWFIGPNQIVGESIEEEQADQNTTISTIKFTPLAAYHKQMLSCRGQNQYLPSRSLNDSLPLYVHYPPILNLTVVGESTEVVENDTVTLRCTVDANPRPYKLVWHLNGYSDVIINPPGIMPAEYFTSILKVTRSASGTYSCLASNVRGDNESNAVNLVVAHTPVCVHNQQAKYGILVQELETISCILESIPVPDYFAWHFNNDKRMRTIPRKMLGYDNRYVSTLTFRPDLDDLGIVTCHGINDHGQQTSPCSFRLVLGGPPEPLSQCHLMQSSTHVVDVICQAGYDGGRRQVFTMVVFYRQKHYMAANVTAEVPHMRAVDLPSGTQYVVHVYASNSRGRSKIVRFEASTRHEYNRIEELQTQRVKLTWLYWIGLPVMSTVCVALMLMAVFLMRNSNYSMDNHDSDEHYMDMEEPNPDLIPLNEGMFRRQPSINNTEPHTPLQNDPAPCLGRNPDLIEIAGEASICRSCQCFKCLLEEASLSAMATAPPPGQQRGNEMRLSPRIQNNYLYEI